MCAISSGYTEGEKHGVGASGVMAGAHYQGKTEVAALPTSATRQLGGAAVGAELLPTLALFTTAFFFIDLSLFPFVF